MFNFNDFIFFQSVVILSKFPFLNLFTQMLDILAPEFFDKGSEVISAACQDIYMWPSPTPGQVLNLPFLGSLLQVFQSHRSSFYSGSFIISGVSK